MSAERKAGLIVSIMCLILAGLNLYDGNDAWAVWAIAFCGWMYYAMKD